MYLTRNQAYRKVPWVRIPPSPPVKAPSSRSARGFFLEALISLSGAARGAHANFQPPFLPEAARLFASCSFFLHRPFFLWRFCSCRRSKRRLDRDRKPVVDVGAFWCGLCHEVGVGKVGQGDLRPCRPSLDVSEHDFKNCDFLLAFNNFCANSPGLRIQCRFAGRWVWT